jgi:hypothetical protein
MKIILTIALITAAASAPAEDLGRTLTNDPFRRPVLEEIIEVELPDELAPVASDPKQIPELRGILRSPRETLVNLNGKLVTVGGKFEGFTVAAVGERTAVLLDGDERHVVSIDDERETSNAARYR